MGQIMDSITAVLKDWVSLILLSLGITFAPHMYWGGLFLALAGAAVARAYEREQARKLGHELEREPTSVFWMVVTTTVFVSTLVAIFVNSYFPTWSVQAVMAISGFASRKIIVLLMTVTSNIARRGDQIADKVINKVFDDNQPK